MTVHIHVDSMKAAEQLANICKACDSELFLRSDKFCVDPKSTLGILAMMYSERDQMYLDTGEMPEDQIAAFLSSIDAYVVHPD